MPTETPTVPDMILPTRERLAAAMQSSAANPETDARKVARLAASFAGDCNALTEPLPPVSAACHEHGCLSTAGAGPLVSCREYGCIVAGYQEGKL